MRKVLVLLLVFLVLCRAGFAFVENSAMFRIITTMPPSAQAGKEIIFEVGITNTGTEIWVAGEYSVFLKVYDANKSYLTETDKTRQFEDIAPGEALSINITFDIPADYSGTYHYRVGMEFEKEALFSHYFILKVLPFAPLPEAKKWTGSIQINYQDSQAIEPTTSLNLRLVNLLPGNSYLKLFTSGRSAPGINPELSNFLVSYHSRKLDLSAGDFATGLSELTLSRSRGVKVGIRLGEIDLVGLVGSSQKEFKDDLYGLGGSVDLNSNLTLGANYVQDNNGQNSVASLEAEFALSPEITLSGEYAWSNYEGEEIGSEATIGNAFRMEASTYSEKLNLNGSYQRRGDNFFSFTDPAFLNSQEEYDISLDYSFTDYISGALYYNQYRENLSQPGDIFRYSLISAGLSFLFPRLPMLSIAYDVNETFSNEESESLMNDTTNTLTIGVSYLIKKIRLSVGYIKWDYLDKTKFLADQTTTSDVYEISIPWTERLNLSLSYGSSTDKDQATLNKATRTYITPKLRYTIIPGKFTSSIGHTIREDTRGDEKQTTNLNFSYYLSKKDILSLGYSQTHGNGLILQDTNFSNIWNAHLTYSYNFTKNQSLALDYTLVNQDKPSNNSLVSQNQTIYLSYKNSF